MHKTAPTPHPIDVHVGQRVRERRLELRRGQHWLASHLGLSFQQLQKYERGNNRISASKLHEIAVALEVPIAYFFEGLDGDGVPGTVSSDAKHLPSATSPEGIEMLNYFERLSAQARKVVVTAVKGLAELPVR